MKNKKKENTQGEENQNDVSSVFVTDSEEVVFVIDKEGKVQKRTVTTGIQDINNIEILTGLEPGEQIVTAPYEAVSKTLKTGTKVKIVTKEELFK